MCICLLSGLKTQISYQGSELCRKFDNLKITYQKFCTKKYHGEKKIIDKKHSQTRIETKWFDPKVQYNFQ